MSLNGYSLRVAAEKLGIHRNTLTNYMGQDLIPRINIEGLVLVPEPTMKNLLWMQSRGIPLTKYLFTDLPHDDGFKDLQLQKVEKEINNQGQELNRLYAGRQNVKYNEPDYQSIMRVHSYYNQAVKRKNQILGILNKPTNSGMGDNATMEPDTNYVRPEFLQLWGEPEPSAYKVEPFMYVGTPDDKSELLKELQDTIAEQEQKLETEYRRDKANNLKLFELKELLNEKQKETEEYMKKWMEALSELESKKDWSQKFSEQLEFETKRKKQKPQSKSKPTDNVKHINATSIDNKGYTKEEDDRLKKMLDDIIKGQNSPE